MFALLTKLKNDKHKYKVLLIDEIGHRQIKFGAEGYPDYTIGASDSQKKSYINRHKAREDWSNPYSKGFWSKHVLWNMPTIEQSLKKITKDFGINVILY